MSNYNEIIHIIVVTI